MKTPLFDCRVTDQQSLSPDTFDIENLKICEDRCVFDTANEHENSCETHKKSRENRLTFIHEDDLDSLDSSFDNSLSAKDSVWESSDENQVKKLDSDKIYYLKNLLKPEDLNMFKINTKKVKMIDKYFESIKEYFTDIDSEENAMSSKISGDTSEESASENWSLNMEIKSNLTAPSEKTSEESAYISQDSINPQSRKRKLTLDDIRTEKLENFISGKHIDILSKYFKSVEHFMNINEPNEKRLCAQNGLLENYN
ncbi:DgyrCDS7477 [Dimorphilus gyrociliatus]|uniref:DgyrCDS7477 n=1 Tax=Dimorphilus gyrociliatus TaxID=2664684 RepID=A0A7I8VR48_9ANNE|nr:DgyrCDS7477 [Dimorphilus gyrociliatus]